MAGSSFFKFICLVELSDVRMWHKDSMLSCVHILKAQPGIEKVNSQYDFKKGPLSGPLVPRSHLPLIFCTRPHFLEGLGKDLNFKPWQSAAGITHEASRCYRSASP